MNQWFTIIPNDCRKPRLANQHTREKALDFRSQDQHCHCPIMAQGWKMKLTIDVCYSQLLGMTCYFSKSGIIYVCQPGRSYFSSLICNSLIFRHVVMGWPCALLLWAQPRLRGCSPRSNTPSLPPHLAPKWEGRELDNTKWRQRFGHKDLGPAWQPRGRLVGLCHQKGHTRPAGTSGDASRGTRSEQQPAKKAPSTTRRHIYSRWQGARSQREQPPTWAKTETSCCQI